MKVNYYAHNLAHYELNRTEFFLNIFNDQSAPSLYHYFSILFFFFFAIIYLVVQAICNAFIIAVNKNSVGNAKFV